MSLLEVYKSLLGVLEEMGGGGDRAERAIRAVSEGLMRVSLVECVVVASFADRQSGQSLADAFPEDVEAIMGQLEAGIATRTRNKALNNPFAPILAEGEEPTLVPTVSCAEPRQRPI